MRKSCKHDSASHSRGLSLVSDERSQTPLLPDSLVPQKNTYAFSVYAGINVKSLLTCRCEIREREFKLVDCVIGFVRTSLGSKFRSIILSILELDTNLAFPFV